MYNLSRKFIESLIEHNSKEKSFKLFAKCISTYKNVHCFEKVFSKKDTKLIKTYLNDRADLRKLEVFDYIWYFSKHEVKESLMMDSWTQFDSDIHNFLTKGGDLKEFVARSLLDPFRSAVLKETLKQLQQDHDERLRLEVSGYVLKQFGSKYLKLFEIKFRVIKKILTKNKYLFKLIMKDLRDESPKNLAQIKTWMSNNFNTFFVELFSIFIKSPLNEHLIDELWMMKDLEIETESLKRISLAYFKKEEMEELHKNWYCSKAFTDCDKFEKFLLAILLSKGDSNHFEQYLKSMKLKL